MIALLTDTHETFVRRFWHARIPTGRTISLERATFIIDDAKMLTVEAFT